MSFLLRSRLSNRTPPGTDRIDATLYDAFITKFVQLGLAAMVGELRTWNDAVPASRATAAMARLLDLALLDDALTAVERQRAATLAIVVEQIVRSKLRGQPSAILTIDGAYRLLLQFGEPHSPAPEIVNWIHAERQRRTLPSLRPV